MQQFLAIVTDISFRDVIDVVVLSVFFYYLLLAIQGTKAVQILQGILALVVLRVGAGVLGLQTISYLLNGFLLSTVVALPVVFQPELRRGLTRLGQNGVLGPRVMKSMGKEELSQLVDEISFAAFNMSLARFGALIVLEQETGLREVVETGQVVDGVISAKLLQTIFHPKTPLHDGAVVICGDKIVAAACFLPLTETVVDARFGTRHRAAIGISEQTDAVVVIVSEETGEIRIAHEGKFLPPMTEEAQVRKALNKLLVAELYGDRLTRLKSKTLMQTASTLDGGQ